MEFVKTESPFRERTPRLATEVVSIRDLIDEQGGW
jgi:hypothetical protein